MAHRIRLASDPHGVAIGPGGSLADPQLHTVLEIDATSGRILGSYHIRGRPRISWRPATASGWRPRTTYHPLVDRRGIPLGACLSAANTHDSVLLEAVVDAVPPINGRHARPGRPRRRPAKLHGEKGYDYPRCRRALRRRGITPRIARRGIDPSQRLGRHR